VFDKKKLSERDICTQYINPALQRSGWNFATQVREEVSSTKGRVLYYAPNLPIVVIEAKDNKHTHGDGMQQVLGYAEALGTPFAYSSNCDGFLMHDRTGQRAPIEQALALDDFPGPEELWQRHCCWKGIITSSERRAAVETLHYDGGSGKVPPRYYQVIAINRTIKSAKGQRGC
jgi:type I restriction enzyme R subunit